MRKKQVSEIRNKKIKSLKNIFIINSVLKKVTFAFLVRVKRFKKKNVFLRTLLKYKLLI